MSSQPRETPKPNEVCVGRAEANVGSSRINVEMAGKKSIQGGLEKCDAVDDAKGMLAVIMAGIKPLMAELIREKVPRAIDVTCSEFKKEEGQCKYRVTQAGKPPEEVTMAFDVAAKTVTLSGPSRAVTVSFDGVIRDGRLDRAEMIRRFSAIDL